MKSHNHVSSATTHWTSPLASSPVADPVFAYCFCDVSHLFLAQQAPRHVPFGNLVFRVITQTHYKDNHKQKKVDAENIHSTMRCCAALKRAMAKISFSSTDKFTLVLFTTCIRSLLFCLLCFAMLIHSCFMAHKNNNCRFIVATFSVFFRKMLPLTPY